MKTTIIFFLLIVVVIGIYVSSMNDYFELPLVYKSTATGECKKVLTPDGEKNCSWLREAKIEKYEVVWVK